MNKAELLKVLDEAINQIRHNDLRLAVMCIGRAKAIVEGKDDWMDDKDNNMPSKDFVVTGVHITKDGKRVDPKEFYNVPKEQKVERGVEGPLFEHKDIRYTSWWEHILLWFHPPIINSDGNYRIMCKKMFGKHYIIKNWYVKEECNG